MAPTTRSSKTNPKKKEHNKSPIKLDNQILHLSPKTTLPTKLPVQHSTSKFDGMDLLMKAIEEHKILCQENKQKLDDFEMRCNSLSTTFAHYITDNNTNLQNIHTRVNKVENTISVNNENHQDLQDKMTKIEDYKDIQDIKLNNLEVKFQKIEKLQYNNPWLDQSNQHISVQDNDYKTFLLLKSSQKDHHFNKFSHMFVGNESVKDHTCECSFSRMIQNFLQTPPEETNHHRGLSTTPLEDDYYDVPVDESTKECVVSLEDLCV